MWRAADGQVSNGRSDPSSSVTEYAPRRPPTESEIAAASATIAPTA
jgi:hypothetical protein